MPDQIDDQTLSNEAKVISGDNYSQDRRVSTQSGDYNHTNYDSNYRHCSRGKRKRIQY